MKARGLLQNSAFALVGDLAVKAGGLAVLMVAGRGLSTAEFATVAAALSAATVLTAGLDAGSQTLITRDGVTGPAARRGLLRALALARLPLLVLAVLGAAVVGALTGRPLVAPATVLIAAAGAAQLSLTGALRAAQDLRPEAAGKLAAGVLVLLAAGVATALSPAAGVLLLAVAAANVLALVPLAVAVRRVTAAPAAGAAAGPVPSAAAPRARAALRRAAPLGALALATLAYYRSGTLALSLLSTPAQTAQFAAASTVAFGLLCLANAVTTGLLPRLVAARGREERIALTRRALAGVTALGLVLGGGVALSARPLLVLAFGPSFAGGATPLALLAAATVLIAPAGVLGTLLVAERRLRPIGVQVGASLAVNVAALALLAPSLGATGAAVATVACEALGLALLAGAAARALPGLVARPRLGGRLVPAAVPVRTAE